MRFAQVSHTRHVSQVLNTRTSAWADTTYLHKNFFSPKTYDNRNQETESPLVGNGVSEFPRQNSVKCWWQAWIQRCGAWWCLSNVMNLHCIRWEHMDQTSQSRRAAFITEFCKFGLVHLLLFFRLRKAHPAHLHLHLRMLVSWLAKV